MDRTESPATLGALKPVALRARIPRDGMKRGRDEIVPPVPKASERR
tara:strand:+ start:1458 stop:1595 length:138 start_codon:yes stop_codon:yes gene_type:complete